MSYVSTGDWMLWFCTGSMRLYPCSVLQWCNFRQHCSQATHGSRSHSPWSIRCCCLLSPVPAPGASPLHQHPVLDWRNAPSTRPPWRNMLLEAWNKPSSCTCFIVIISKIFILWCFVAPMVIIGNYRFLFGHHFPSFIVCSHRFFLCLFGYSNRLLTTLAETHKKQYTVSHIGELSSETVALKALLKA